MCQLVVAIGYVLVRGSLRQFSNYIFQREQTFIDLICFFLLGHGWVWFFAALWTGQVYEADFGRGASVCTVVKGMHNYREDKVRSWRVFIHGCAGCFSLAHSEVVHFFCVIEWSERTLLDIIDVDHASVGVFAKLQFRLFRLGSIWVVQQIL